MSIATVIEGSPIAAVITNPRLPDNPIIACNTAFEQLTGYSRDEILNRNCRFLAGAATEPRLSEEIRAAVRKKRPALVEILNYKKNGTPFRNAVLIAPIFDEAGELEYFLGSQVEVRETADGASQRADTARKSVGLLPARQRQVLARMAAGKLNKQIAHELGIAERTVKMHRAALMETLGARTSADAIRIAVEAGL